MSSHTGESTGSGIRGAASAVHGLGETIRGTINTAADSAVGSDPSKNQAIRDRGVDEINTGRYHGTGAGVTPADTAAERHNRAAQGEYPSTTSTGLGSSTHNPTTTTHSGAYDTAGTTGYGNPQSTNAGPHGSNIANKADPRVDSDLDSHRNTGAGYGSTTSGYGNTTGTGYGNTTGTGYGNASSTTGSTQYDDPRSSNHGPHSSNIANKVDPRVDSDFDNRARTGNQTGAAAGPHSSNLANKADPRVDSDRDHRRGSAATAGLQPTGGLSGGTSRQDLEGINPTEIKGGYTTAETTTGHSGHGGSTGLSGVHESHVGNNPSSTNHGPHSSKIANKLDPRVDSDADNRARTGNQTGAAAGPHSSNLANKADPRVDSDLDNRAHRGTGTTTDTYGSTGSTGAYGSTGSAGYGNTSTNHGTHDSNLANKADPRFDSDLDNRARTGNQTGAAAGPHSSNLANKADPRVDSDRDNRAAHHGTTTGTTGTGTGYTDTTSKHARSDSATHTDATHDSHPSHGTGLVGKVLDKVDPRVKNA
ncbi:Period circadian protein [Lasiodiplodia theobromae]|uniref:Period circadian protein n=1 Tax=Lasiodiplodia theobromae TaxID=45133 RepID=UPI0015C3182B|nr:Period circadian protein [Lasiodiplodia theobromae]KAF4546655.1 Period circadian protein [Lasiodiplodia theobromae]